MTDDIAPPPPAAAPKRVAGSVRTFACPSCGGTITIHAVGITITAVCASCGSIIDVANENLDIIKKAAVKTRKTRIPLGTRGTLLGTAWEVIGYTGRNDGTGQYVWAEYLLFNPYQGFRYLVEADGHWNFVTMLRQHIAGAGTADVVWFEDRKYRIYNRGDAVVQYVMGEFYWRVKVHDKARVADYICPPYILSMEDSGDDIIWSHGVYVDSEDIRNAFIPKASMPAPKGISPNQPSPYEGMRTKLFGPAILFVIALIVFQCIALGSATNQVVYERTVQAESIYQNQTVIADPIDIPGATGNLEIRSESPIYNDWVELNVSLVSDATKESEDLTQSIEYYYGRDSDGNWTEGGQHARSLLSGIKGGKYHLLVQPDAGSYRKYPKAAAQFTIRITRNVPVWSNFWVAFLMLTLYPLYMMTKPWAFEMNRWAGSDYTPTIYKQE